jgi:hypothetical protein
MRNGKNITTKIRIKPVPKRDVRTRKIRRHVNYVCQPETDLRPSLFTRLSARSLIIHRLVVPANQYRADQACDE